MNFVGVRARARERERKKLERFKFTGVVRQGRVASPCLDSVKWKLWWATQVRTAMMMMMTRTMVVGVDFVAVDVVRDAIPTPQ